MNNLRYLQSTAATVALVFFPAAAFASDFSELLYLFMGIAAVLMLALSVVAYFATRRLKSILYQSLVWGTLIALVVTPVSTPGDNGMSSGPPIFDIVISALGADPIYAIGAFKALLVSVPVCSALVALFIWGWRKQDAEGNDKDGT